MRAGYIVTLRSGFPFPGVHPSSLSLAITTSLSLESATPPIRQLDVARRLGGVAGSSGAGWGRRGSNCKAARFVLSQASEFEQDTPACDGGVVILYEAVTFNNLQNGFPFPSVHPSSLPLSRDHHELVFAKRYPLPPHTPAGRCDTPRW